MDLCHARGDILIILDADLTVPPEDLPRFYEALTSGKGEFINGVRLVYPMEKQAMRFANLVVNKLFSLAFSWLLGKPVKDTLSGIMWRTDLRGVSPAKAYKQRLAGLIAPHKNQSDSRNASTSSVG